MTVFEPVSTVGARRGRRWEAERDALTVFDSTSWAVEDLGAAEFVLDHAERFDLGFVVDLLPNLRDPYDPDEIVRR